MIEVKETRGAKPKYNFNDFQVGEKRSYNAPSTSSLLNSANGYCRLRKLKWSFRCYKDDGIIYLVRIV